VRVLVELIIAAAYAGLAAELKANGLKSNIAQHSLRI